MITAWLVLFLVAVLHLLKHEQDPTWHMASEYAIGDFGYYAQVVGDKNNPHILLLLQLFNEL